MKSFLPNDEHQHDLKEAYFDLRSESSLVLGVDSLVTLQQWRHCIKTQTDTRLSEINHTQSMNSIRIYFKTIFTQKSLVKFAENGHPRLGWVCFLIRFGEMCLCISVSPKDALQWMGAVRMRVQTDKKKSASPVVSHIKTQPHICLELFCLVNAAWSDADFSPDSDQNTFSLEEELLWIMDSYFSKKHLDGFVSAFVFSRC